MSKTKFVICVLCAIVAMIAFVIALLPPKLFDSPGQVVFANDSSRRTDAVVFQIAKLGRVDFGPEALLSSL
jgi:hypothetical protein